MPKATTKADLVKAANEQFGKLWDMIDPMPDEVQNATFDFSDINKKEAHWGRDRNIRDVLTHLYEWHQLVLSWVANNENGEKRSFLPPGITWANYQIMNVSFFEKHQNTSYDESKRMVRESHEQMIALMEVYSEEELFDKNAFNLGLRSSIAEYCRAATSSHYNWAITKVRMHIRTYRSVSFAGP
ncbi:MAG: ClbS/DfsB family four-helix bundle protein [Methanomassiliicoccaceae archaeon]|nr:ClbS/DfsB family four-helix bundle protein [Methanomassiliicoccaceae archaeon]